MRIPKQKSRKPILVALVVIIAIVIIGLVAYTLLHRNSASNETTPTPTAPTINYNPPTDEQTQSGIDQKQNTINNAAPSTSSPTPSSTLSVTQTSSGQDGGTYRLRYLIDATLSDGTCTLTLTKDSQTVTKSAPIQALASSSTCQGFNIATNELSAGTWKANLSVASGSTSGTTSNQITVE